MPIGTRDSLKDGRYQITKYLGEGTWGIVYLADDTRMGRKVAIKLLKEEVIDLPAEVRRFEREPILTAKLGDHPYIVNVYDFEKEQNDKTVYYSVMEYVDGGSLRDYLRDSKSLCVLEALDFATDICHALDEIHSHNMVHCDLKPGNVMLKQQLGRVVAKVADFGNVYTPKARQHNDATPTGVPRGTFQYSSPEQLTVEPGDPDSYDLDGRSDLYALGAILYEMVTGSPPFVSDDTNYLINLVLSEPPKPPTQHNAGITKELEEIILRTLQKEPEARFTNAREMISALQNARLEEQVHLDELKELLAVAEENYLKGDYHAALKHYKLIQNKNPAFRLTEITAKTERCERNVALAADYRDALAANEAGSWQEASRLLEKVISQESDYDRGKAKDLLDVVKEKWEAQQRLNKAREFEKQGDWETAALAFQDLIRDFPLLIRAGELLEDVPRRYAHCQDRVKLEKLHNQVESIFKTAERTQQVEDWGKVINLYEEMEGLDPHSEEIKKQQVYAAQQRDLAVLYRDGIAAQEQGNWIEAASYFERITHIDLRYRDTAILLADINKYLKCQQLYEETKDHLANQDWEDARSNLTKIIKIKPDFQNCQDLLHNLTALLETLELEAEEEWAKAIKKLEALTASPFDELAKRKLVIYRRKLRLDELYSQAIDHQARRKWIEAKNILEEIQTIERPYKDVPSRLREVRQQIRLVPLVDWVAKRPLLTIIILFGVLIVTAVLGSRVSEMTISPTYSAQVKEIDVLINGEKIDPNVPQYMANQDSLRIIVQLRDVNESLINDSEFTCQWTIGLSDWPDQACVIDYRMPADRNSQLIQVEVVKNDPKRVSGELNPIVFVLQRNEGDADE